MPTNNPNAVNAPPQKSPIPTKKTVAKAKADPAQQARAWAAGIKYQGLAWFRKWDQFRNIEDNNFALGQKHMALGNLRDAIFRFRFVTWLNPKRADAFYYLGCCRMAVGDKTRARLALEEALKLKPNYEEAAYILAVVANDLPASRLPKKMPLTLAREFFDSQAAGYNHAEIDNKDYRGHTLVANAIRAQYMPGRIDHTILELGVGTGLCGPLLRDTAAHISGVDISQPMLQEAMAVRDAKDNKVYDALINQDVQSFLNDSPDAGYDVVMAASLFSYIGDLAPLFPQMARVLKKDGIVVFTADKADKTDKGEGYYFDGVVARFRYSLPYLEKLAADNGLTKVKCEEVVLYPEYPSWLCVFKK